jgi:zinc transporter 5/7
MFFDCTGLLAGLVANVIVTKWKSNDKYSYGYLRAEIIAGFTNSLFLLFISFFIMTEALERLLEPPEVKHDRLFLVSVLGFFVNLIGIYAFNHGGHGHSHGGGSHGHSHGSHGHSHGHSHNNHSHLDDIKDEHVVLLNNHNDHSHNHNDHGHSHNDNVQFDSNHSQIMRGVFLHILADTLGSVGVIISTLLMNTFGWMIADPICSMFIALLIALSVLSLIKESIMILMQRSPVSLDLVLPQCYNKITGLAGVYSVQEPHFWTLCSDYYVGAVKLEVSKNVDPKYVVSQAQNIFTKAGIRQIYIQLDYSM